MVVKHGGQKLFYRGGGGGGGSLWQIGLRDRYFKSLVLLTTMLCIKIHDYAKDGGPGVV